jgi:hypothetical protein
VSVIALSPKPGSPIALATAMKKVSMPTGWPSAVFVAFGAQWLMTERRAPI